MTDLAFLTTLVLLIIVGYWSLVTFPKQRAYKKHVHYVRTLEVGDEVITYGGIIGKITALDEEYGVARLEISEGVEVRIIVAAIQQHYNPEEVARNIRMAEEEKSLTKN
jgi:preprotein translocase subunit YajC